jgi:PAS domain S-box-containing protein
VETTQEGIWVWDIHGHLTFANAKIADMLGYSAQEMIGRPVLDFVELEMQNELEQHLERRRAGIAETYSLRLLRRDGSGVWTLIAANPMVDAHGHFVGGLSMITDMTFGPPSLLMRSAKADATSFENPGATSTSRSFAAQIIEATVSSEAIVNSRGIFVL